jgi:AraC-like DNA-binding protein
LVIPIKTIAFDCGYTVVSNFYRDFKRVHGLGPTEMRRRYWSEQLREDRLRSGYVVRLNRVRNGEIAGPVDSPSGTIDQQTAA